MKVLVDTPIWSYALRSERGRFEQHVRELEKLIVDQGVLIIGPVRQEVLSGYSEIKKFERLSEKLKYFENAPIIDEDYIQAAKFSNICRKNGVQGSHIDFLICSVAYRLQVQIFTTDKDFSHYQNHVPIKLFTFQPQG
ncbi:MAG: PIN domain-containing protein [Thermodesulfobacteriota bacterium]|nr:PIN domain-containing protein [Thermodesulfobacteriota bacterium]